LGAWIRYIAENSFNFSLSGQYLIGLAGAPVLGFLAGLK